jgi:hypothetical protein
MFLILEQYSCQIFKGISKKKRIINLIIFINKIFDSNGIGGETEK